MTPAQVFTLECPDPSCHKEMDAEKESALSAAVVMSDRARAEATRAASSRRVFDRWKQAAHAVGVVQTRFLMLVVYVIAVVPDRPADAPVARSAAPAADDQRHDRTGTHARSRVTSASVGWRSRPPQF